MLLLENKFDLGDIVYLATDEYQKRRLITGITVCIDNIIVYQVSCGTEATRHYEFEITAEENIIVK